MTDQQLLTLCISIAVPLALLIYSNSRVTDAKETLRAEMALGFERVNNKTDHLAGEVATLKEEVFTLKKDLASIKEDIAVIKGLLETHLREDHGIR